MEADNRPEQHLPRPPIVILTHGRAGEELVKSAEMIIGAIPDLQAISLMPDESPEDFSARVRAVLDSLPAGALILTDLFGGTPSNTAAHLSREYPVAAVSGVNLPMLVEAASSRDFLRDGKLTQAAVDAGKQGVVNIIALLNSGE